MLPEASGSSRVETEGVGTAAAFGSQHRCKLSDARGIVACVTPDPTNLRIVRTDALYDIATHLGSVIVKQQHQAQTDGDAVRESALIDVLVQLSSVACERTCLMTTSAPAHAPNLSPKRMSAAQQSQPTDTGSNCKTEPTSQSDSELRPGILSRSRVGQRHVSLRSAVPLCCGSMA